MTNTQAWILVVEVGVIAVYALRRLLPWAREEAMTAPWRSAGPDERPDSPGLEAATKNLYLATRRAPTEADRPPLSTFPMTKAARAAIQLRKGQK